MLQGVIAIDGGGTKCQLKYYDLSGNGLSQARTGAANIHSDVNLAIENVRAGIKQLELSVGDAIDPSVTAISAGLAGYSDRNAVHKFSTAFANFADLKLCSDLEISCFAANQGEDCGLIIIGTGSNAARYEKQQVRQIGGHGFLLGDQASGANLGQLLLREYCLYLDKLRPYSAVFDALSEQLGDEPYEVTALMTRRDAAGFAEYAPLIIQSIDKCELSAQLVEEALEYLMAIIETHLTGLPLFFDGGLAPFYQDILKSQYDIRLAKEDACFGAFRRFVRMDSSSSP